MIWSCGIHLRESRGGLAGTKEEVAREYKDCASMYLRLELREEGVAEWKASEDGSFSSKIEGATDLVRCECVRSCAIDYAIRRDTRECIMGMGFTIETCNKWDTKMQA